MLILPSFPLQSSQNYKTIIFTYISFYGLIFTFNGLVYVRFSFMCGTVSEFKFKMFPKDFPGHTYSLEGKL